MPVCTPASFRCRCSSSRAFAYCRLDFVRVNRVRVGVAVNEDGRRARGRDGLGCGEEGVGGDDYFVARPDAAGRQRELYGRRAVRDADALARADVTGERALERLDLATEDEGRRVEHAPDSLINFGFDGPVLRLEINEGNVHTKAVTSGEWRVTSQSFRLITRHSPLATSLIIRAGLPATTAPAGTSRVTTAPAPTIA